MKKGIQLVVYPVKDLERGKSFFALLLGTEPAHAAPYYVGFQLGDQQVGLDPNGKEIRNYVQVPDLDQAITDLVAAGATLVEPAKSVGGTQRIALITDHDGNRIGLMS